MSWFRASNQELTHERLLALLHYDPQTGIFTRRISTAPRGMAGTIAGDPCRNGYLRLRIDRKRYLAHRVAWFYMTGEWPPCEIDHKNLKRDENWWDNLRLADRQNNTWNIGAHRDNQTGLKGVSYRPKNGNWIARIRIRGKEVRLGVFSTPEAAHAAYVAKAKEVHGEFARGSVDNSFLLNEAA